MKTPNEVQADMIRELEAKVSLLQDDLFYAKAQNAALKEKLKVCWDEISALVKENAELLEDKARLDWMDRFSHQSWVSEPATVRLTTEWKIWPNLPDVKADPENSLRYAIDSARKEAQP